jgi:plastocyanin
MSSDNEHEAGQNPATKRAKKNNFLYVVGALCLIVLVVIAVRIITRQTPTASTARVTVMATGFQPSELAVKTGTKVVWTNEDTKGHSVGANPYPSHDSLRALVSPILSQDQTYTYTFDKAGTYYYHDDQNPTLNAKIVVTD